jgi:hypothetical protein
MYTDPDGEVLWFIPLIYIGVTAAINVATHYKELQETTQDKGGWAAFGQAMGFFALGAVNGAVSWYCPALAPVVGIGTSIVDQGLSQGSFKDINYGQIFAESAISIVTSSISNGLVNTTFGKADFFTKTLAGNMIKGAVSKNISDLSMRLIKSSIYTGSAKDGWEDYKRTGWWQATLQGMNDGMKTHYKTNSHDMDDMYKRDYKEQMKNRDFRQTLSKTMKNDMGLSKFDRFELQMYRLSLPFTKPGLFIPHRQESILIINATVDPEIIEPTIITIPKN